MNEKKPQNATTSIATSSTKNQSKYVEGEKILCYHGALIYEAKCLKVEKLRSNEYSYLVHYNGWSKNWDEWVPSKRILKFNEENLKKQSELQLALKNPTSKKKLKPGSKDSNEENVGQSTKDTDPTQTKQTSKTKKSSGGDNHKIGTSSSAHAIENKSNQDEPMKKKLCLIDISSMYDLNEQSIRIPDCLQEWLVDDLDFILEQNKILNLPSSKTVSMILNDYQKHKQSLNTDAESRYLPYMDENINGIIKYFDSMLGSQLLYKFERLQYKELLKSKKPMSDIYGAIHLLRLMEKLNQILFCDVKLEQRSLENLIYFSNDILKFMESNCNSLFDESDYINPTPFYVRASI